MSSKVHDFLNCMDTQDIFGVIGFGVKPVITPTSLEIRGDQNLRYLNPKFGRLMITSSSMPFFALLKIAGFDQKTELGAEERKLFFLRVAAAQRL